MRSVWAFQWDILLTMPMQYFFCGSSMCFFFYFLCLVFAMHLCASVYMYLVVTCWERADLLALVCVVYENCSNMNASGFITFITYMLRQNVIPFWK